MPPATVLSLFIVGTSAQAACAGSVEVWPVRVELPPGQLTTTLTVANRGEAITKMQVRTFSWTQEAGADRLEPTREFLASPPIFELPAGATQVIRLVLRKPAEMQERTYRLLLDELPAESVGPSVEMTLRMSIPLFQQGAGPPQEVLNWRVERGAGSEIAILAVNQGTSHVRLDNVKVSRPDGKELDADRALGGYVLVGSERKWTVPSKTVIADGAELRISATTGTGPLELTVPMGNPGAIAPTHVTQQP